jgi:hypothetical protein
LLEYICFKPDAYISIKIDIIKIDLKEIGCEDVHWVHLAKDNGMGVVSCEDDNESLGSTKGGKFLD